MRKADRIELITLLSIFVTAVTPAVWPWWVAFGAGIVALLAIWHRRQVAPPLPTFRAGDRVRLFSTGRTGRVRWVDVLVHLTPDGTLASIEAEMTAKPQEIERTNDDTPHD